MTEFELYAKAVAFAAEKHMSQTRRDGKTPYIEHPLQVAALVKLAGGDMKAQITALLHDTLEDTDATEEELSAFGPDILEAVCLLTREKGADEEQYVQRILANKMAAMVKNADKLHNVSEAPFCADQAWARRYVQTARAYYFGRFSKALDEKIADAEATFCIYQPVPKPLSVDPKTLMLYSDQAAILYRNAKEKYEKITKRPDFHHPQMEYWYHDLGQTYFCFIGDDVWTLCKAGWVPRNGNPLHESEDGADLFQVTREEVVRFIEKGMENHYFYDFVEREYL